MATSWPAAEGDEARTGVVGSRVKVHRLSCNGKGTLCDLYFVLQHIVRFRTLLRQKPHSADLGFRTSVFVLQW